MLLELQRDVNFSFFTRALQEAELTLHNIAQILSVKYVVLGDLIKGLSCYFCQPTTLSFVVWCNIFRVMD